MKRKITSTSVVLVGLLAMTNLCAFANPMDDAFLKAYRARPQHKALGAYANGIHLMNQDRIPEAVKQLEEAVKLDPTCYGAMSALGYIWSDMEKFDKALVIQNRAVELAPKNEPGVYSRRMFTFLALYKNEAALKDMDRVLELEPQRYDVLQLRAKTHMALKQPDLALKDFELAIKVSPHPEEIMYKRAELYTKLKRYDKALFDYTYLVKHFPKDVDAYTGLAEVYRLTGKFQLAINELNKALKLEPENPGYCFSTRAFCFEKLGKIDLAKKDMAEAKKHGITKPGRAFEFLTL